MKPFDRRHRWGPEAQEGVTISRTCQACGRTASTEILMSTAMVRSLLDVLSRPSPFRSGIVR